MAKKGYKMMTEKDFTQIKELQKLNLNSTQVHEITKRSYGVIGLVKSTATWKDYQSERTAISRQYKPLKQKTPESVNLPKAVDTSNIVQIQERIAVANERQADALERLCQAWENAPNNNVNKGFKLFRGSEL